MWPLTLPPMNASGPASLDITAGEVANIKLWVYARDHWEQNRALRQVVDFVASRQLSRDNTALLRCFRNLSSLGA